jgi:hypothetical protein
VQRKVRRSSVVVNAAGFEEPSPQPTIDRQRAETAIRDDFAVRRRAAPDLAQDAYFQELDRLSRGFLEVRPPPGVDDLDARLAQSRRSSEKIEAQRRKVAALRPGPNEELFFTAEAIAGRRRALPAAEAELARLRNAEVENIRRDLQRPPPPQLEIPPRLLEAARRDAELKRRQLVEELDSLERRRLSELESIIPPTLKDPEVAIHEPLGEGHPAPGGADLGKRPPRLESPSRPPRPGRRDQADPVRTRALAELRVVAEAAARELGYQLVWGQRDVEDITDRLREPIRRLLHLESGTTRGR